MGKIQQAVERARLEHKARTEKRVYSPKSEIHLRRKSDLDTLVEPEYTGLQLSEPLADQVSKSVSLDLDCMIDNRIILGQPSIATVSSYKMLRTRLLQQLQANGWNSVGVTSTLQGEGKSLSALNLAISIATDSNYEVVLADFDFRNPSLHKLLGVSPDVGLADYIENSDLNLSHILLAIDQRPRLFVLPNTRSFEHSAETLSVPRITNAFRALCAPTSQRIVLCDLPPLLVDDAIAFAPNIDCLLLVICEGKSKRSEIAAALDLLPDEKLVGSVLNCSDEINLAYY